MKQDAKRGLKALESFLRKQEWDIAELTSGLAQVRTLTSRLSSVAEGLNDVIAETESGLRFASDDAGSISIDALQRGRHFLAEQREELARVLNEHQRAEALAQEFIARMTELRVKMRLFENMADRKREALAAEEEKAMSAQSDELWLTRIGSRA